MISLVLPYTHPKLVKFALNIPITQILPKKPDELRKKLLRKLAISQKIPEEFSKRPKKAAQYGSGVHKTLRKIAKTNGITLKELIRTRLKKVLAESDLTFC